MKKVFHFDAPREWYVCDAAILSCFDSRFDAGFAKFLKQCGIAKPDPIRIAGGAKVLVSPDRESDRAFILQQIRSSIRLHGTRRVILMLHTDCGAYGRLEKFKGDAQAEALHHQQELQLAAEYLKTEIPDVTIEAYFVDFDGVWDAQVKTADVETITKRQARPA